MGSEPQFYVLERELFGPFDTDSMQADGTETGGFPSCPACGAELGMLEWLPPFRVELEVRGRAPGDYTLTPGGKAVVSERFVKAFQSEKLSGVLSFEPVRIVKAVRRRAGPRLGPIPPYFLMQVCFGRGALDDARSLLRRERPVDCTECRRTNLDGIYGFKIEPGTWQGEDIFRPRGFQSDFVVSERFTQLVKDHGLTNVKLIPTEQFWWDPHRKGPPAPAARA
jgi:hypothetical protein